MTTNDGQNDQHPHVLILGISSWIGHGLAVRLADHGEYRITGTRRHSQTALPDSVSVKQVVDFARLIEHVQEQSPDIVVNMLQGHSAAHEALHQSLVTSCERSQAHYVFASSILALDAHHKYHLTEDLEPLSNTPYGAYKGRCEQILQRSQASWLALRFASIQGHAPHRETRNTRFLRNLKRGEVIRVDHPVVQNRLHDSVAIEAIDALIAKRSTGVIHLGTDDSSTELEFLRRVACRFGWDPEQVVRGSDRAVNLVAVPGRIIEIFGSRFKRLESDTIDALAECPHLKSYSARRTS